MGAPDRFWRRVDKSGECWTWTGPTDKDGYGLHSYSESGRNYTVRAHRMAFRLGNGHDPGQMLVCHRCDNPSCVRPEHLFLGTAKDNFHDCLKKGRYSPVGTGNAAAKLDPELVEAIRARYAAGGVSQQRIADEMGVAQTTVSRIVLRHNWTHI